MGAWKSSDGGSITPIGGSSFQGSLSSSSAIVSSGDNVRGVTIRTIVLRGVGALAEGYIRVGSKKIAGVLGTAIYIAPQELFIPAGNALNFLSVASTVEVELTYDLH